MHQSIDLYEGGCIIRLTGNLDETFDPDAIVAAASGVVVFDLDRLERVSSFGVRLWLHVIRELKAEYWAMVRCRPIIARQIAAIEGFMDGGDLLSGYVDYWCHGCGAEVDRLVDLRGKHELKRLERELACPECDKPMEPGETFDFLQARAAVFDGAKIPPLVDRMLSGAAVPRKKPLGETPGPGKEPTFWVSLFTRSDDEKRRHKCQRLPDGDLGIYLEKAPLQLFSIVRVRLERSGGEQAECDCTVSSGKSAGTVWFSVVKPRNPSPQFLRMLEAMVKDASSRGNAS